MSGRSDIDGHNRRRSHPINTGGVAFRQRARPVNNGGLTYDTMRARPRRAVSYPITRAHGQVITGGIAFDSGRFYKTGGIAADSERTR